MLRAAAFIGAVVVLGAAIVGLLRLFDSADQRPKPEERFRGLIAGAQERTFTAALGAPEFSKRVGGYFARTYAARRYFVSTVVDESGTVLLYAITARSHRYPIKIGGVVLGRTKFSATPPPTRTGAWFGVHNFYWAEEHYLANPGNYQTEFYAFNDSATDAYKDFPAAYGSLITTSLGERYGWMTPDSPLLVGFASEVRALRDELIVNTYAVSAPLFYETPAYDLLKPARGEDEIPIGPDSNDVRVAVGRS